MWRLFLKVNHKPKLFPVVNHYMTQRWVPGYKRAYALHNGETWSVRCFVQKMVRCKMDRRLKTGNSLCLVKKQARCMSVATMVNGRCRVRGCRDRRDRPFHSAWTFGRFKTAGGRNRQLPPNDPGCWPRPPIVKRKSEWCEQIIALL